MKKRFEKERAIDGNIRDAKSISISPKSIALVAYDWRAAGKATPWQPIRPPHFAEVHKYCTDVFRAITPHRCDTVLFAPWTSTQRVAAWSHKLFPAYSNHRTVILGSRKLQSKQEWIQVWEKGQRSPMSFLQVFGSSAAPFSIKHRLIEALPRRILGHTALIICGETNILRVVRHSREIMDDFGARQYLWNAGVKILLNPIHTRMSRPEMRWKRAAFSEGSRWTVAVWNRGFHRNESAYPWDVHYDGQPISNSVVELQKPVPRYPGVRIGVLNLS